jgi:hypothetical protein
VTADGVHGGIVSGHRGCGRPGYGMARPSAIFALIFRMYLARMSGGY